MKRTTQLRYLMQQKQRVISQLDQQSRSPSRGFNEDEAFARLDEINDAIDAELTAIDTDFGDF